MREFRAIHRHARIAPRKVRLVADQIRGTSVNQAIEILEFSRKRAAAFLKKVLRSALANASQEESVNVNRLFVKESRVDGGPLAQGRLRFRPGPMGRAMPIHKRTSHIHVILAERVHSESGGSPEPDTESLKTHGEEDKPRVVDPRAELEASQ